MKYLTIMLVTLTLGLTACSNRDMGTVTGGVVGGLVGSQFGGGSGQVAAASAGTLIGSMIGNRIGDRMDKVDRMYMAQSMQNTPTGQTANWTNSNTGYNYAVQPTSNYYQEGSQSCRNFTTTVNMEGKNETVQGRACQTPDGNWKISA